MKDAVGSGQPCISAQDNEPRDPRPPSDPITVPYRKEPQVKPPTLLVKKEMIHHKMPSKMLESEIVRDLKGQLKWVLIYFFSPKLLFLPMLCITISEHRRLYSSISIKYRQTTTCTFWLINLPGFELPCITHGFSFIGFFFFLILISDDTF